MQCFKMTKLLMYVGFIKSCGVAFFPLKSVWNWYCQVVKQLLATPRSHIGLPEFECCLHFPSNFIIMLPGRQHIKAQIPGFLPPTWELWCHPVPVPAAVSLQRVNQLTEDIALQLCLPTLLPLLLCFQINKTQLFFSQVLTSRDQTWWLLGKYGLEGSSSFCTDLPGDGLGTEQSSPPAEFTSS